MQHARNYRLHVKWTCVPSTNTSEGMQTEYMQAYAPEEAGKLECFPSVDN